MGALYKREFNKVTAMNLLVSESFELEASQHFLQLDIP